MLVREERILLGIMVKDCFCVGQFLFYLSQKVYLLHQWVCQSFEMVLFGLVVIF